MRITFITGWPGAGKTTYAQGTGRVTYDMDSLADALDYGCKTRKARDVAGRMLRDFITAADEAGAHHINVIRVTPSPADMAMTKGHEVDAVEVEREIGECMACRPAITAESWSRIVTIHEKWLKNNRCRTVKIPQERW